MRITLWLLIALAALGFGVTFVVEGSVMARAQRVQLVRMVDTGSKIGPSFDDVGDPIRVLDPNPKWILVNKTPFGDPMVDIGEMEHSGGRIVRLDSALSTVRLARLGCAVSAILCGAGLILLARTSAFLRIVKSG